MNAGKHLNIVVDSQYSLDVVNQVLDLPSPVVLSHKNNFDIIVKLWKKLHSTSYVNLQFEKIKSHQTPDDNMGPGKIFRIWGNSHADESAKIARTQDMPGFIEMHQAIAKHDEYY